MLGVHGLNGNVCRNDTVHGVHSLNGIRIAGRQTLESTGIA